MDNQLERVTPKQAAKELNMDVICLHHMMRHERLPIGMAFRREGCERYTYIIYRGLLDAFKEKVEGRKYG